MNTPFSKLIAALRDFFVGFGGYEVWPRTGNGPAVKGPQPRIIMRRQGDWLEKQRTRNDVEPECKSRC